MHGELPVPIALDLEDLVDEARHLDLEVVVALRGRARLVEPDVERPGGTRSPPRARCVPDMTFM